MEIEKAAATVFEVVRGQISKAVAPLLQRIDQLERQLAEAKPAGVEEVSASVMPALLEEVRRSVAEIPPPKDGNRGDDGTSVTVEDVHPVLMLELSKWALDFERRAQDVLERAIARMPAPKDGVDGIGWEAMKVEYDGERTVTLVFDKGDDQHTFPVTLPVVLDRGFYGEGKTYQQADGVTFGGSYWIAQKATDTKPGIGNPDWRLAVKKGRDARGERQP